MTKTKQKILLFLLLIFSLYCSLSIGRSWDEGYRILLGKSTFDYLLSFGRINNDVFYREFYSPIYWTLQYFISKISLAKYQIETIHLINLAFSFATIFGIGKVCKELFNRKVSKIMFLILFFYPIFFGHMSFNPKDMFLAFGHVWIFYSILRYLKKQNIRDKANKYIILIGLLAAASTGIQLVFLGSFITVFLFILVDILLVKKFVKYDFNKKLFLFDLSKSFIIFYFILTLFWTNAHSNILTSQFNFFMENLSGDHWRGWPFNLINGKYYFSQNVPKFYIFINLLFKSPEYFLVCYLIFPFIALNSKNYFKKKIKFFNYKLFLIISVLLLPNLILFFIPFPVYDGMRLFLWSVPYFCIIPALTIYFLLGNFKKNVIKVLIGIIFPLVFYFLFNFLSFTPYQYSYLNIFNGKTVNSFKKFENDYWGGSLKELIKKSDFLNENKTLAFCGVNHGVVKYYLTKYNFSKVKIVNSNEDFDFIVMTNRTQLDDVSSEKNKIKTCFDKYQGNDLSSVKRNGLVLSTIREK